VREFTKIPIDEAIKIPDKCGLYELLTDRWWAVTEDNCLMFYGKGRSPQCNSNRAIVDKWSRFEERPPTTPVFIKAVFVKHECEPEHWGGYYES